MTALLSPVATGIIEQRTSIAAILRRLIALDILITFRDQKQSVTEPEDVLGFDLSGVRTVHNLITLFQSRLLRALDSFLQKPNYGISMRAYHETHV